MPAPSTVHPIVHLAIDIQPDMVQLLGRRLERHLPKAARTFATAIAPQIPTIWVAYGKTFQFYSRDMTHRKRRLKQKQKVAVPWAEKHEDIFIKADYGAFDKPALAEYLREKQTTTVVITGIYTLHCVFESIRGAIDSGFHCFAITDLMANGYKDKSSPEDKKSDIGRLLRPHQDKRVEFLTAAEFLNSMNKKPAPPVRTAPVSRLLAAEA